jgi:hypothetical protein
MPTIHNFGEAVLTSLAAMLLLIPAIIGAIILLVIGWFLADIVARLVGTLLRRIGFETIAQRTGVTGFITMTGAHDASASRIIAELVKWFIRLIFIEMAAEALHISAVTNLINSIVLFIPNLIVALVVVMVGFLIASFVANLVRGGATEMGFQNPNLMAGVARAAIMVFAVIVALSQVGIAATLVNALFIAFVGAIALAVGLAFGLGGRDVAGQMWQQWYKTGRGAVGRMEEKAAASGAEAVPAGPGPIPAGYHQAPPPPPYPVRHERAG